MSYKKKGLRKPLSIAAYELAHRKYFNKMSIDDFEKLVNTYHLEKQQNPIVDFEPEEHKKCLDEIYLIEPYLRYSTFAKQIVEVPFR